MKKLVSFLVTASMTAGIAASAFAVSDDVFSSDTQTVTASLTAMTDSENKIIISMRIGEPNMTVNGETQEIDPGMGTVPVIANDRTLIPVRAVVETLGGEADWNGDTRTATLSYGGNTIDLTIDSTTAYLNGDAQTLDTTPVIINDRTMLPIRFIAEGFGFDVEWDQSTQTVTISGSTAGVDQPERPRLRQRARPPRPHQQKARRRTSRRKTGCSWYISRRPATPSHLRKR